MIVVDASVVVDMLLGPGSPAGDALAAYLSDGGVVAAPHLVDAEVGQALRRYALRGEIGQQRSVDMVGVFSDIPMQRYAHRHLLERAFELRNNVTVYDGLYLALAELLDLPLMTGDRALGEVPGCNAVVDVVATSA